MRRRDFVTFVAARGENRRYGRCLLSGISAPSPKRKLHSNWLDSDQGLNEFGYVE